MQWIVIQWMTSRSVWKCFCWADGWYIQSRTNKHNKCVISWSTKILAILIADSDSGWRETSKNTPPKFFPRVVVLANFFGQNFSKNVAVLNKILVFRGLECELLVQIWDQPCPSTTKSFVYSDLAVTSIYGHPCSGSTHNFLLSMMHGKTFLGVTMTAQYCKVGKYKISTICK